MTVFVGVVLLASLNFAFALEDPYEIQSNRFTSKPTICVIEPNKDDLSIPTIKSIMRESKSSIYDWIIPLQEKSSNKNKWAVNYLKVSDKKLFDFSSCNIIINFKNEMNAKTLSNLGTHQYLDGVSYITIFYKTNECVQKTKLPCKTNTVTLITKIGSTLRHEFGHAIGLGHYRADKSQNKEWFEHPDSAPSIMLAYSKGTEYERVTASDIDKVVEIYKDSGFTNQNLPKPRRTLPIALTQIIPSGLFLSDHSLKASKEIGLVKISGMFEKKNAFLETIEIIIVKPDFKIEKIKSLLDRNGYFEHEFEVHSKLPKGIYYVQAKYGKNITEKNTFEIS